MTTDSTSAHAMTPHERLVAAIVVALRDNPQHDAVAVALRIAAAPEHEYADPRWTAYTLVDDHGVSANPDELAEWLSAAQTA